MYCVGRASAVAEQQHFIAVVKGLGDERRDLYYAVGVILCKLLFDPGTVAKAVKTIVCMIAILGNGA